MKHVCLAREIFLGFIEKHMAVKVDIESSMHRLCSR